tara:strand:- start:620 stop:898 length:279 start_codon:yes stop_codon:yes gene_type:complete
LIKDYFHSNKTIKNGVGKSDPKREVNKMNYSDFIEAVQSNLEIGIGFNKLQKILNNYINSGLLGDPYEDEENEFDDGDIDNALDMIETDYGC